MHSRRTASRAWIFAWIGGAAIGIANGVLREATYGRRVDKEQANRLSVLTGVIAFTTYFAALQRRWPLRDDREAREVGALWLALTVFFEFSFGRLVARKPWAELAGEYDIRRGRLWPLLLAWIAVGPAAARRVMGGSARCR